MRGCGREVLGLAAAAHDPHDPVAGLERERRRPDGLDGAGELQAGDVGRHPGRGRVVARPLVQVGPVDAGAVDPHEDLVGGRFGDGPVLDDEAAAFVDD